MSDSLSLSYYQNLADDDQLAGALGKLLKLLKERPVSIEQELATSIESLQSIVRDAGREYQANEIAEINELGMHLLENLYFETRKNIEHQQLFNFIAVAFAYWVVRKGGTIHQLEFPVNAIAQIANSVFDKVSLEALYEAATFIISSTEESVIKNVETAAPGNPWKVLIINYAIIATRTHNPDLIESAYQTLIRYFPDDLSMFFTQAMSEMSRLNYPQHVRNIVERYHQQYSQ